MMLRGGNRLGNVGVGGGGHGPAWASAGSGAVSGAPSFVGPAGRRRRGDGRPPPSSWPSSSSPPRQRGGGTRPSPPPAIATFADRWTNLPPGFVTKPGGRGPPGATPPGVTTSSRRLCVGPLRRRDFRDFLSERGVRDARTGIVVVDPPVHFGGHAAGEADYIRQMGGVEQTRELEEGVAEGLRALLGRRRWEDGDGGGGDVISRDGPVLELGAGQGTMSRPIVSALGDSYPYIVLSDTSAGFLEYTKGTLTPNKPEQERHSDEGGGGGGGGENADARARVEYVTLGSLNDVPSESVSLLALRYVLHHIPDWKGFVRDASGVLLPGGVLLKEEPVADGFFVQRAIVSSCLEGATAVPSRQVRKDLEYFVHQIGQYLRTDIDKGSMEDKHLFSQHELYHACQDAGLSMRLFPNQGLDHVSAGVPGVGDGEREGTDEPIRHSTFSSEFHHYFVQNFQFGAETVAFFEDVCYPPLREGVDVVDGTVNGPVVKGVIFAIKTLGTA